MIHSSAFQPKIYPFNGSADPDEIDRLQDMSGTTNLKRDKVYEIGRDDLISWKEGIPEVSMTLKQNEYGTMRFWNMLANKATSNTDLTLNDFKTSYFDIAGFATDDSGTFLSTMWYPEMRLSGFGLNIGDPEATVERTFTVMGEDAIVWQGNNKYLIYLSSTATGAGHQIVIGSGGFSTYPDPISDPDSSGATYLIRVLRYRGTTTTQLTLTTDFTYNSSSQLITIPASQSGDVYRIWYTATTYISGVNPFVDNDSDAASLSADSVSVYLQTSNYLYRLQSVAIDVSFDRQDLKEIGSSETVQRGIREKNVRITLGRLLEAFTIEEVLRGCVADYGKLDPREFSDNIELIVKIYNNRDKDTFLLGYKFTNLVTASLDTGVPLRDYVKSGSVLSGDACEITDVEGNL